MARDLESGSVELNRRVPAGAAFHVSGNGYAQISSSVGTRLFSITLPIRETFIRCL